MDRHTQSAQGAPCSPWTLFDSLGTCVAVTQPDGTLEFCNASLLQLTGQSTATLMGSSIFSLLGTANGELRSLHHAVLATNMEQRARSTQLQRQVCRIDVTLRRLHRHRRDDLCCVLVLSGSWRRCRRLPDFLVYGAQRLALWDLGR